MPRSFAPKALSSTGKSKLLPGHPRRDGSNTDRANCACCDDSFENLGLFAAAVVAANVAKVPNSELNTLTTTYLISRAIFNL